jgi:hypothetical protein
LSLSARSRMANLPLYVLSSTSLRLLLIRRVSVVFRGLV